MTNATAKRSNAQALCVRQAGGEPVEEHDAAVGDLQAAVKRSGWRRAYGDGKEHQGEDDQDRGGKKQQCDEGSVLH